MAHGFSLANLTKNEKDALSYAVQEVEEEDTEIAWSNPDREEKRTFHAKGDGTFIIDGETVDLRHKMTKWEDCI